MKTPTLALLALTLFPLPAAAQEAPSPASEPKDLVATAQAAGSFGTLAKALVAAGLVDALRGPGPFTVFAPTDEAFARLPAGTLEGLLAPAAHDRLVSILTYHVVPGRVLSTDLLGTANAKTLQGAPVPFGLRVGRANVIRADVLCSNGVIHVIDEVLLPPESAPAAAPAKSSASVTGVLRAAIDRGAPLYNAGDVAGCVTTYEAAARALVAMPADAIGPMARADLERTLALPAPDARTRAWDLRRAFDRILDDAAFEPLVEAPMPAGFPKPGPVGQVVVKTYPAYRAARADGGGSFFTLFRHIQKHDVAMTAPVEMTMGEGMQPMDMAFLYGRQDLGSPGQDGAVAVLDLPPTTVLSFGLRGNTSPEALALARAAIEARRSADGWTPAGPYRLLGYNSPMVPAARRFSELQLPVRR